MAKLPEGEGVDKAATGRHDSRGGPRRCPWNMEKPDSFEKAVRFVCGFLCGLFVGFRIMLHYPQATGVTVGGVMVLLGLVCGLLAMLLGDRFWTS